jgi:hypothetical protein
MSVEDTFVPVIKTEFDGIEVSFFYNFSNPAYNLSILSLILYLRAYHYQQLMTHLILKMIQY